MHKFTGRHETSRNMGTADHRFTTEATRGIEKLARWVSIACVAIIMQAAHPAWAQSGLGRSGRWLSYDDKPLFAVGFDCQELASDTTIDFETKLDSFVTYEINKVRLWVYTWFKSFNPTTPTLTPWARDATGKHDLETWDDLYWQRVKSFIAAAQQRGIVVELSIFAPYPFANWWWPDTTFKVAWNKAFNVNGAFSSNANGHFGPQFFDLSYSETSNTGKTLAQYQQALVDKTVAELSSFPNVYFEVCNEFAKDGGEGWQVHWANRLAGQTTRLVGVQPYFYASSWTYDGWAKHWNEPAVDLLNLRFAKWNVSPQTISDLLHAAQSRGKILSVNESNNENTAPNGTSFAAFLDHETRYAWAMTLAGGYFTYYWDDSSVVGGADWVAAASRLQVMRHIVERLRFWELSPVDASGVEYDGLVTQGPGSGGWQVMANPGSEYLAYFWGTPSAAPVLINLPAGSYAYAWYDTRDEATLGSGEVSGGAAASIPPPAPTWHDVAGTALLLTLAPSCGNGEDCDSSETCLSCPQECGACDGPGCRGVSESAEITLSCPAGQQIATIDFASYGTPNGSCDAYTVGACHATSTVAVVESACVGDPTCSVEASNTLFGDPCAGVSKRLYVQYSCEAVTGPISEVAGPMGEAPSDGGQRAHEQGGPDQLVGACSAGPASPPWLAILLIAASLAGLRRPSPSRCPSTCVSRGRSCLPAVQLDEHLGSGIGGDRRPFLGRGL